MNVAGEKFLSDKETATALGVAPTTPAQWRCKGKGPVYLKVGKNCFYRPSDIAAWLEKQLIDPARRKEAAA
jgi:hypothetical protein